MVSLSLAVQIGPSQSAFEVLGAATSNSKPMAYVM